MRLSHGLFVGQKLYLLIQRRLAFDFGLLLIVPQPCAGDVVLSASSNQLTVRCDSSAR